MDRWQYLIVLGACLAHHCAAGDTAGPGVYRQARRTAIASAARLGRVRGLGPVAIGAHVGVFNPEFVSVWNCPPGIPIEELLFFIAIPLCVLLT